MMTKGKHGPAVIIVSACQFTRTDLTLLLQASVVGRNGHAQCGGFAVCEPQERLHPTGHLFERSGGATFRSWGEGTMREREGARQGRPRSRQAQAVRVGMATDKPGIGETLSDSQVARLEEEIGALPDDGVREVVRRWPPARQVAELICRPVALPELVRRRYTGESPLFFELGPDQLKLENGQKLTGRGQLRGNGRWYPFHFECDLDTRTGGVAGFRVEFTS
ncbi:hypothetical protein EAW94_21875 [Salmonella enterica]|nr:hypothetical protein [Salmonella enterica]